MLLELLETFTLVDGDIRQSLSTKSILRATHRTVIDGLISIRYTNGVMENYGLVTYRETALLYDDQHPATANK
ncbi:hypothetical protein Lal_00021305 [Lupinus albus]|nr:hypothetical protein Lal_00021305 [Lupinus albus]